MIRRLALLIFLAGGPLVLSSCALAKAPFGMMSRMLGAGGRSLGIKAENTVTKPFRLETGEIEKARGTGEVTPLPEVTNAEVGDHVAAK